MLTILFDMDGVLVDSEPVITAAGVEALKEWGIPAKYEDFKPFTGMGEDSFIGGVARKHGVAFEEAMKLRAYDIYLERLDAELYVYPGMLPMMDALAKQGRTMAVASAADRVKVEANIRAAKIRRELLAAVITGSDVVHKKPAPDIYLAAAKAVDQAPDNCLVVEDAVAGIAAAMAAGMRCVAVTTAFTRQQLLDAGAVRVIDDIAELPDAIAAIEAEEGV